jgi:hypothetical protein
MEDENERDLAGYVVDAIGWPVPFIQSVLLPYVSRAVGGRGESEIQLGCHHHLNTC